MPNVSAKDEVEYTITIKQGGGLVVFSHNVPAGICEILRSPVESDKTVPSAAYLADFAVQILHDFMAEASGVTKSQSVAAN